MNLGTSLFPLLPVRGYCTGSVEPYALTTPRSATQRAYAAVRTAAGARGARRVRQLRHCTVYKAKGVSGGMSCMPLDTATATQPPTTTSM